MSSPRRNFFKLGKEKKAEKSKTGDSGGYLNTVTYESGPTGYDDFPYSDEPVFILGCQYSALYDREKLKEDVRSRIWITYRRCFPNIGGTGPSSDQGWGCMLRCGQMMLAQALLVRHLGRAWQWKPEEQSEIAYWRLLEMFEDRKAAIYSIHQIASMGEAEGKAVGQWFGPNTIAQVLKRISVYDKWSNVVIHVALDNVVVKEQIYRQCKEIPQEDANVVFNGEKPNLPEGESFSPFVNEPPHSFGSQRLGLDKRRWRPLLLIIPQRLGLTEINPIYFSALKKCLSLRQSVGIIGGKPNHAHYFVGYIGQELIYLDPHTTQHTVDVSDMGDNDASYHCMTPPSRMSFHKLDPSIAVGFFCLTEDDFEEVCQAFSMVDSSGYTMFEVRNSMPNEWPYSESPEAKTKATARGGSSTDFHVLGEGPSSEQSGSQDEEEFEII